MTVHDDDARTRVRFELDSTLVVVAGAGTGKTTALVGRIVELVRSGRASLREIAAITFTEAAAAELRQRVREKIEEVAAEHPDETRLATARLEVDEAAVSTLHAFAQRVLVEHCVAAGIPPGFDVMDETAERADFDARFARFADTLLADPDAEPALVQGFSMGLTPDDLVEIARALNRHWDRLVDGGLESLERMRPGPGAWPQADGAPVVRAIDAALAMAPLCRDDQDKLKEHLDRLALIRAELTSRAPGIETLQYLEALKPLANKHGQQTNWGVHLDDARDATGAAEQARLDVLRASYHAVLGELGARLASFVMTAADERRARRTPRVPRPARARPPAGTRRPRDRRGAAPSVPAPPHRRIPGHRSDPGRVGGPHRGHRRRLGRSGPRRAGRALRGGRPQAVDLPVPARRHRVVRRAWAARSARRSCSSRTSGRCRASSDSSTPCSSVLFGPDVARPGPAPRARGRTRRDPALHHRVDRTGRDPGAPRRHARPWCSCRSTGSATTLESAPEPRAVTPPWAPDAGRHRVCPRSCVLGGPMRKSIAEVRRAAAHDVAITIGDVHDSRWAVLDEDSAHDPAGALARHRGAAPGAHRARRARRGTGGGAHPLPARGRRPAVGIRRGARHPGRAARRGRPGRPRGGARRAAQPGARLR